MNKKTLKLKKMLCLLTALLMLCTVLPTAVFAEDGDTEETDTPSVRYVSSNSPMSFDAPEIEGLVAESLGTEGADANIKVLRVTKPCTVYASMVVKNEEQTGSSKVPMPYALNYEILLNDTNSGWCDSGKPNFEKPGGDFEYIRYEVTAEDIANAGGEYILYCGARAAMYPSDPIDNLGQIYYFEIHAYNTFHIADSVTIAGSVRLNAETPYAFADENGTVSPATEENYNIYFDAATGELTLDNVTIKASREDFTTESGAVKAAKVISFADDGDAKIKVLGNCVLEYTGTDTLGNGAVIAHNSSASYNIDIYGGGTLELCGKKGIIAYDTTVTDTTLILDCTGSTALEATHDLCIENAVLTASVTNNPNGLSICSQHGMSIVNSEITVDLYQFAEEVAVFWVFGGSREDTDRFCIVENSTLQVNSCDDTVNESIRALHANYADITFNNSSLTCDTVYGISSSSNYSVTAYHSDIRMDDAKKVAVVTTNMNLCEHTNVVGGISGTQNVYAYTPEDNGVCICGEVHLPVVQKYKTQVRFTGENGVIDDAFDFRLISVIPVSDWDDFFVDADGNATVTAVGFIAANAHDAATVADAQAAVENGTALPEGWKTASTDYIQKVDETSDAYFGCVIKGIKHSTQTEDIVCSAYVAYTNENGETAYVWYRAPITAAVFTNYDTAADAWKALNPSA